jgi:hypothetical protein
VKQLSAFAYRDGKGGVTLGINSMIRHPDWDLVVANPKDAERFRTPNLGSEPVIWFQEINEQNKTRSSDLDWLLCNLNVKALTMQQATPEWFLLRMLSCTSSSTDGLLVELKNVASSNAALIDPAAFSVLHSILTAVHGPGWSPRYVLFLS